MRAIQIISGEHRTSTAVLHGILFVLRHVGYGISEPDFELLGAMISYLRVFPERLHHPKDVYLFRLLRKRHPAIAPLLDRLQGEHRVNAEKFEAIEEDLFGRYRREGSAHLPALYEAVATYAAFHYSHMRAEEDEVLPAAAEYLTVDDWDGVPTPRSRATPILSSAPRKASSTTRSFAESSAWRPRPGRGREYSREARQQVAAR